MALTPPNIGLSPNGVITSQTGATPDYECLAYCYQREHLKLVNDIWGGTSHLRRLGGEYLPQEPKESNLAYKIRLQKSVLYNGFKKSIEGLTGMVFKTDPISSSTFSGKTAGIVQDIDYCGTPLNIFCSNVFEAALRDGHTYIYVDYSVQNPSVVSRKDEEIVGNRVNWVHILKSQVINWKTETLITGEVRLVMAVIKEETAAPEGLYGEKRITQYRVLYPGRWEIYQENKQSVKPEDKFTLIKFGNTAPLDYIPLIPVYCKKTGFFTSEPPLLELAYLNVAHFQIYSDYRHILHVANVPILWFIGRNKNDKNQEVGPNAGVDLNNGGSMGFAEHRGSAIGGARTELQDLEERMSAMGLEMLAPKANKIQVTATERVTGRSSQMSMLSRMATLAKGGFDQALKATAEYYSETPSELNLMRNFDRLTLDPQTVLVYIQLRQQGIIDDDVMWSILTSADWIPDGVDLKKMAANIKAAAPPPLVTPPIPNPTTGPEQFGGRVS